MDIPYQASILADSPTLCQYGTWCYVNLLVESLGEIDRERSTYHVTNFTNGILRGFLQLYCTIHAPNRLVALRSLSKQCFKLIIR